MDSNSIRDHIGSEVDQAIADLEQGGDDDQRHLAWLRRQLTEPREVQLRVNTAAESSTDEFWLVTDDDSGSWYVVFEPRSRTFGLAAHLSMDEEIQPSEDADGPRGGAESAESLIESMDEMESDEIGRFLQGLSERLSERATPIDPPRVLGHTYLGSYGTLIETIRAR